MWILLFLVFDLMQIVTGLNDQAWAWSAFE